MKTSTLLCTLASALCLTVATASAGEIAVIVKTTNSNFWQNVNKGAAAALQGNADHTLTFDGPAAESAVADEVNLVENAINRGVDAIVLAPSDPEALVPSVRRANEAGIPIAIIDSSLGESGKGLYQTFLATDNCAAGEMAAKAVIDGAGKTGKVAVM